MVDTTITYRKGVSFQWTVGTLMETNVVVKQTIVRHRGDSSQAGNRQVSYCFSFNITMYTFFLLQSITVHEPINPIQPIHELRGMWADSVRF